MRKSNNFLNNPKWRKRSLVLSCSKKLYYWKESGLLKGITSKNNGHSYCLNCLHSFRTKNKLNFHQKICENKDFCGIVLSSQENNILKLNQNIRSKQTPCIIYADLESLIQKMDVCSNNPENSSTTKIGDIFLADIQCQLDVRLIIQKTSIVYIMGKIPWKRGFFENMVQT